MMYPFISRINIDCVKVHRNAIDDDIRSPSYCEEHPYIRLCSVIEGHTIWFSYPNNTYVQVAYLTRYFRY